MSNTVMIVGWVVGILTAAFSGFLAYEFLLEYATTDPYSYSNSYQLATEHFDLRMELDFDRKVIKGEQKLSMRTLSLFVMEAILDIKDLDIHDVLYNDETPCDFRITRTKPELGQALHVRIPFQMFSSNKFTLTIKYTTSPDASALSWLAKNQTKGGVQPYLFSQCETIHCRSIAPFQDSPAIKSTFTADVHTPKDIIVRTSGNLTDEFDYDTLRRTKFESKIPIPSYLFSIIAGDIAEQQIGNRTFVIAEKTLLANAVAKLANLEKGLVAVENYLSPYVWGNYKIVIQPASFPYEGMENPMLSFASPTLVSDDGSSVFHAYHEIAHAWAGNLVTHNTWLNVWIKEAFATFIERKISKNMQGDSFYKIFSQIGKRAMTEAMKELGETNMLTSLHPSAENVTHPDLLLTPIQSEKGYYFLLHIEKMLGETLFAQFMTKFFNTYRYKSVGVKEFETTLVNFIYEKFDSATANEIYGRIGFETWMTKPGLPPVDFDFTTPEYTKAIALAEEYIINAGSKSPANYRDYNSFSYNLKFLFLEHFLKNTTRLTRNLVSRLDSDYSLYYLTNPNLISLFMQMAIESGYYAPPFRYPSEFVGSNGKIDAILPVYARMAKFDKFAAQELYKKYEYFYHPAARYEIKQVVGL